MKESDISYIRVMIQAEIKKGLRDQLFDCPICHHVTASYVSITEHVDRYAHPPVIRRTCLTCGNTFLPKGQPKQEWVIENTEECSK